MNHSLQSIYQFTECIGRSKISWVSCWKHVAWTSLLWSLTVALLTRNGEISWLVYFKSDLCRHNTTALLKWCSIVSIRNANIILKVLSLQTLHAVLFKSHYLICLVKDECVFGLSSPINGVNWQRIMQVKI